MSDIDWGRAKELLNQALELPEDERQEFFERLHSEDAAIGEEVQTLATAHAQAEQAGFLDGGGTIARGPASGGADQPDDTGDTDGGGNTVGPAARQPTSDDTDAESNSASASGSELTLIDSKLSAGPPPPSPEDTVEYSNENAEAAAASEDGAAAANSGGTLAAGQFPPPPSKSPSSQPASSSRPSPSRRGGTRAGSSRFASWSEDTSPPPGTQLIADDYEVLEELGVGGMGVVYRAFQHSLRRHVALKIIPTRLLRSGEQIARFYLEAEAAGRLDHPGIVPVQNVGEHDGVHFYAMAIVEGGSLAKFVSKSKQTEPTEHRLTPRRVAEVMEKVCRAVQYAHDHAVIHRDIKPANILLDEKGNPRLTDFGLAKVTDEDEGLTVTGQVMGTPSYMAPEQAEGKNAAISNRTDVYSLGATAYALLAGKPPFTAETLYGTLRKVQNEAPPALDEETPLDLVTICSKCLAKQPEDRYPSAGAVADDLRRYLDGYPISARRLSPQQRVVRWARRNPTLASLIGAVAAALLLGTVVSTGFAIQARREAKQKSAALEQVEAGAERLSKAIEDTFIFASEDLLADEPGMQAARQKLLEIAKRYYQELIDTGYRASDKQAAAAFMLGRVEASLGLVEDATRSFEQAIAQQKKAIDERPGAAAPLTQIARSHNEFARLGKAVWHEGQIDRPTEKSRAGLEVWLRNAKACAKWRAAAAALEPDNGQLQRLHANGLMNLALAKIEEAIANPDTTADTASIDKLLAEADAIREVLLKKEPGNGDAQRDMALGIAARADLRSLEAERAPAGEARPLMKESLRLTADAAERLANLPPETRSLKTDYNLATCHQLSGRRHYQLGETSEAVASYEQMLSVMERLLLENPRVGIYRTGVAEAQLNLSMLAYDSDDLDGGADLLADCQDTLIDGVAIHPGGESLDLLVKHTTAIAEGLALNDRVTREVQLDLLKRATGLIERAQDKLDKLLANPTVDDEHTALITEAQQKLQVAADAIATRIRPDRGT